MSETTATPATTETPVTTTAPKKGTKKAAPKTETKATKKGAKAAPVAAKVAKKGAKKGATKKDEPSVRLRVFQLLAKSADGLTGKEIQTKLGLLGVPALLKDEGVCDKPRIKRSSIEGRRGVVYQLTALGKAAVEKNLVDENAAPLSAGKEWPSGK